MESTVQSFKKVKKQFALNNSYFKNKENGAPETILEIAQYQKEHNQLPFAYSGDNWVYDAFVERQKRNGVHLQQFLTPDNTADRIAELATMYAPDDKTIIDACCGTGQLTAKLFDYGFNVIGFDFDHNMVELCKIIFPFSAAKYNVRCFDFKEIVEIDKRHLIVSNPPYDNADLTTFLNWLWNNLTNNGTAILLIPNGFLKKERPKVLFEIISKFELIHSEPMIEPFARTTLRAEIVILNKIS